MCQSPRYPAVYLWGGLMDTLTHPDPPPPQLIFRFPPSLFFPTPLVFSTPVEIKRAGWWGCSPACTVYTEKWVRYRNGWVGGGLLDSPPSSWELGGRVFVCVLRGDWAELGWESPGWHHLQAQASCPSPSSVSETHFNVVFHHYFNLQSIHNWINVPVWSLYFSQCLNPLHILNRYGSRSCEAGAKTNWVTQKYLNFRTFLFLHHPDRW